MSKHRVRYISVSGEERVYVYERKKRRVFYKPAIGEIRLYKYPTGNHSTYLPATFRCLQSLKKTPLIRVVSKRGAMRWRAGQRGPVYNHDTVQQLIKAGLVIIAGDVAELKGVVR